MCPSNFDPAEVFDNFGSRQKKDITENLTLTRVNQLLSEPPERYSWILDDILGVGSISLLCSSPKVGKTTLLYSLSRAIVRGEEWLNRPTLKSRCVVLFLEDRRDEIRKRYQALGMSNADELYVFCGRAPRNPVSWLYQLIDEYKPGILIADTWLRLFSPLVRDINCYNETTAVFDDIIEIARTSGVHLMFTHHIGKRGSGTSAILGSTGLFSSVDTAILLQRYDQRRTIQTVQRYGFDVEEQDLILNPATMEVKLGEEPKINLSNEQRVESALMDASTPLGINDLREHCRMRKTTVCQIVNSMIEQGRVKKTKSGYLLIN